MHAFPQCRSSVAKGHWIPLAGRMSACKRTLFRKRGQCPANSLLHLARECPIDEMSSKSLFSVFVITMPGRRPPLTGNCGFQLALTARVIAFGPSRVRVLHTFRVQNAETRLFGAPISDTLAPDQIILMPARTGSPLPPCWSSSDRSNSALNASPEVLRLINVTPETRILSRVGVLA
jgi:hypothetical protein